MNKFQYKGESKQYMQNNLSIIEKLIICIVNIFLDVEEVIMMRKNQALFIKEISIYIWRALWCLILKWSVGTLS